MTTKGRKNIATRAAALAAAGAMLIGSSAWAQDAAPKRERRAGQDAPLRGPQVRRDTPPGVVGGMGAQTDRRMAAQPIPLRRYSAALRTLMNHDDPKVRATQEQAEAIRALMTAHGQITREYMSQHGEELRELRRAVAEARESGDPAALQALQQKAEQLRKGAPGTDTLYTEIWSKLNDSQRTALKAQLERRGQNTDPGARAPRGVRPDRDGPDMGDRAPQDRRAWRRGAADRDDAMRDAPAPSRERGLRGDQAREGQSPEAQQRTRRLMTLWRSLTPEQQDRLLQRLEAFSSGGRQSEGAERRRAPGRRAPAADREL